MSDTRTLTINEDTCGHTIVSERLADWTAPNEFLRELVEEAKESSDGTATATDDEGCEVTAVVK